MHPHYKSGLFFSFSSNNRRWRKKKYKTTTSPAVLLSYDWQNGSIPLVEDWRDWRNVGTLVFYTSLAAALLYSWINRKVSLSLSACYTYLVLYLLRPSAGAIALFGFPLTCHYAPISSPFDFFSYILGLSVLSPRPMLSPSCVVLYRRRPFRLDVTSQQASTHRRLGPAAAPSPSIHVNSRNRQRLMALREHFLSLSYFSIAFSYALVFTVFWVRRLPSEK